MRVRLEHNTPIVRAALRKAPDIILRLQDLALHRGALEVTRDARSGAPKASSELTQSIQPRRLKLADWVVETRHRAAGYMEEGTDGGGWPPRPTILEWMRQHGIVAEDGDQDSLAFLIQSQIFHHGTMAQPFMKPAFESNVERIRALNREALARGVREVGERA